MLHQFLKYTCILTVAYFVFYMIQSNTKYNMKKCSEETQTLRAGCSKVEPKDFAPPQTPFPGARDGKNVISWRWSLPFPIKPSLVRIDARNFELSW